MCWDGAGVGQGSGRRALPGCVPGVCVQEGTAV